MSGGWVCGRRHPACDEGRHEDAATLLLEGYGPQILGFLYGVMGDYDTAGDAFGQFSEDLWSGLPAFKWRSSARTWAYTVARNASRRYHRSAYEKRRKRAATGQLQDVAHRVATRTLKFMKTDIKDRFRELRQGLSELDRTVLILRIDRKLSWQEVAEVLAGEGEAASVAALKMRFKRLKTKLRDLAQEAGLLEG